MEVIELGDKVRIPSKSTNGQVVFIGETHFADGTWIGIILDEPKGKHNGIVDNICYFKCPRNHGIFIKAHTSVEKHLDKKNASGKYRSVITEKSKYPNCLKTASKLKFDNHLHSSKTNDNRRTKPHPENKKCYNLSVDNTVTTNEKHTKSSTLKDFVDNNNACETENNSLVYKARYPNYLRASAKLPPSHFCKCNDNKGDEASAGDYVSNNNDKKFALLKFKECTDNDSMYKEHSSYSKRIKYPNYLKSSSKLKGAKSKDDNEIAHETQTLTHFEDFDKNIMDSKFLKENTNNALSEKALYSGAINYQNTHKAHFKVTVDNSCAVRYTETNTINSLLGESQEIQNYSQIQDLGDNEKISNDIQSENTNDQNIELEAIQYENQKLKNKLKSAEETLNEAVSKYNKLKEEIKYMTFDNKCQKKQINYQKCHLKLLKLSQKAHNKKNTFVDTNQKSDQKDQLIKTAVNQYINDVITINALDEKIDLENLKDKSHILELEEQNKIMMQGLIELRDFLNTNCKSSCTKQESSNVKYRGHFLKRNNKKDTFVESFGSPIIKNHGILNSEKSTAELEEFSEALKEMTKFCELIKDKGKCKNDSFETSFENNYSSQNDCDNANDGLQDLGDRATINISSENSGIQDNYETARKQFPYPEVQTKPKIGTHYTGDSILLRSLDPGDNLSCQTLSKKSNTDNDFPLPVTSLNEQNILEKFLCSLEDYNSKNSELLSGFPTELSSPSMGITKKHIGDNPMLM